VTPPWQKAEQQNYAMPGSSWQQSPEQYNPMPSWQQTDDSAWPRTTGEHTTPRPQNPAQAGPQSLLPVPYENGNAVQPFGRQSTISLQLVPEHALQDLIPIDQTAPETVYVPPMYTKPRPIVPRYRIISGLLSVIIMALIACSGAGYYAKTSGVLAKTTQFVTGAPVKDLPISSNGVQDPPEQTSKDFGPAYNAIPSATTALIIDKNNVPRERVRVFKTGQPFYLTFSVQAPDGGKGGIVHTKWYTDGKYYTDITSGKDPIKPGEIRSGSIQMHFTAPLSGRVELYWNDQFAQRLYFAVK
jgi:hypothetical protein